MEWKSDVKYVIPSNELLHLKKLVRIKVNHCRNLEEVFEVEEGLGLGLELLFREEEEVIAMKGINSGLVKSQTVVEIPNLMHVELQNLKSLKYISRSNHHGILLKFSNLTTLSIIDCNSLEHVFTSSMVGSLQQLQDLHISECPKMEVIVRVEGEEDEEGEEEEEEEVFDEPRNVVEIPNLTQVELKDLDDLKYIWKSNHHVRTVLEFPNLTTMSIDDCRSLEHVFTSSMVGSLQQLQHLHIHYCPKMEVIVKVEEEEEIEWEAEVKKIVLPRLKSLKLNKLKSLKGFCLGKFDFSWPSLHTLEITDCPEITVFSKGLVATPNLNIIDTSFGRCYLTEDINSFIKTKQDEGFSFSLGEYLFYSSEDESEEEEGEGEGEGEEEY